MPPVMGRLQFIDTVSVAIRDFYCSNKVHLRVKRPRGVRPRCVVFFHSSRSVRGRNLCRAVRANFLLAAGLGPHVTRGNFKTRLGSDNKSAENCHRTRVCLSLVPTNQQPACFSKSGEIRTRRPLPPTFKAQKVSYIFQSRYPASSIVSH